MDGKDRCGGSSGYSEKSGSRKGCRAVTPGSGSKRFKGIEQFLRRIAFNLGNTPSQTEVKIISCIPIDVTDLQQKIISLENQLAASKPPPGPDPSKRMTTCCLTPDPDPSKRNVTSSNLPPGPDPSKRIVTQALHETTVRKNPLAENTETGSSVNTFDLTRCNFYPGFQYCISHNKSVASEPLSSHSVGSITSRQACSPSFSDDRRFLDMLSCERTMKSSKMSDSKQRKGRKSFFGKKKKHSNKNLKTQYVYYAQTESSPFNRYDPIETSSTTDKIMTRSYLADIVGKQYKPDRFEINLSDISKFSSPVCRDAPNCNAGTAYEPDVLSFCQGPFQNVDNHLTEYDNQYRQLYNINNVFTEHGFYDSTFYDVVPVKEKPAKVKKTFDKRTVDSSKKMEESSSIDMKCWPGDVRTKLNTHPVYEPFYSDHQNLYDKKATGSRRIRKINKESIVKKITKRRHDIHTTDKQIEVETSKSCSVNIGKLNPTAVNKTTLDKSIKVALVPAKTDAECLTTVTNNNDCQTATSIGDGTGSNEKTEETLNQIKDILQSVLREVKDNNLPRAISNDYQKRDANIQKGESLGNMPNMTFNLQGNIPDSFQSYLPSTVNSGPQSNMNGSFQNSLPFAQNSRLLNSFSYSPFNMPSSSRQFNNTPYAYIPQTAPKCFQHFPLFFQYPGRQTCACYRHGAQGRGMRQPTTTATNTDEIKEERSKETQKLIKEIYKSMALTMGGLNKNNNSLTEYELKPDFTSDADKPPKKIIEKPEVIREVKKVTNVVQAVSELFRKRDLPVSSESPNMTAESRPESNEVSTRTATDDKLRKERLKTFLKESKQSQTVQKRKLQCTGTQNTMTGSTSDSETSTITNTESEATIVQHPPPSKRVIQVKKEKRNLLSKMFQSVKLFKPKETKKQEKKENRVVVSESVASSSESGGYSTVYSQKIESTPKRNISKALDDQKQIAHSKVTYKQAIQRDRRPEKTNRRVPYMEQEYRRYWDEKLMYQDNRHSMGYHGNRKMPYYRTYEARAAFVEPAQKTPRKSSRNRYEMRPVADERQTSRRSKSNQAHKAKTVEEPPRQSTRKSHNRGYETRVETVMPVKAVTKTKAGSAPKVVRLHPRKGLTGAKISMAIKGSKGLAWFKKHKMGIRCGADQWKQLILEGC